MVVNCILVSLSRLFSSGKLVNKDIRTSQLFIIFLSAIIRGSLCVSPSLYLFIFLSLCVYHHLYLYLCQYIYIIICLSIYIYLYIRSVLLYLYPFICLSIYLLELCRGLNCTMGAVNQSVGSHSSLTGE